MDETFWFGFSVGIGTCSVLVLAVLVYLTISKQGGKG